MSLDALKPYAKALVLLAVVLVALIAEAAGVDVGLDPAHYIGLLLADLGIFAVPNKGRSEGA